MTVPRTAIVAGASNAARAAGGTTTIGMSVGAALSPAWEHGGSSMS